MLGWMVRRCGGLSGWATRLVATLDSRTNSGDAAHCRSASFSRPTASDIIVRVRFKYFLLLRRRPVYSICTTRPHLHRH